MTKLSLSIRIYIALIVTLAVLSAISIFLPTFQGLLPTQELPASKPVLALANAGISWFSMEVWGFSG